MSAPLPDDEKSKRNAYANTERVGWSENIPGVQRIQLNSLPQHFNSNSSLQFLSSSYVWTAKENNQQMNEKRQKKSTEPSGNTTVLVESSGNE